MLTLKYLIKTIDQIIHIQRDVISGIAKPNGYINLQITINIAHKTIKNMETILVNSPSLLLSPLRLTPKNNSPKGKTAKRIIAKTKWIKCSSVKTPINTKEIEDISKKVLVKKPILSFSTTEIVKIPKEIPLIIKLKLKKSLNVPRLLNESPIQENP
ncbi:MAG: hypothetical protein PHG49_01785 [Candidatus Pacebacteria bacterium]|nr:hypothetical protein [Candidatus Paceibacterota bacterium]